MKILMEQLAKAQADKDESMVNRIKDQMFYLLNPNDIKPIKPSPRAITTPVLKKDWGFIWDKKKA